MLKLRYPLIAIAVFGSLWGALIWQVFPTAWAVWSAASSGQDGSVALVRKINIGEIQQSLIQNRNCDAATKLFYLAHLANEAEAAILGTQIENSEVCELLPLQEDERVRYILNYTSPVPWEPALQELIAKEDCDAAAKLAENVFEANDLRIVHYQSGDYEDQSCQSELSATFTGENLNESYERYSIEKPFGPRNFHLELLILQNKLAGIEEEHSTPTKIDHFAGEIQHRWLSASCFRDPHAEHPVDYERIAGALSHTKQDFETVALFEKWIATCKFDALNFAYRFRDGDGLPQSIENYFYWGQFFSLEPYRKEIKLEALLHDLNSTGEVRNLDDLINGVPGLKRQSFPEFVTFDSSEEFPEFTEQQFETYNALQTFSSFYRLATSEDFAPAQLKLAEFYATGKWVEQSDTEAYAMLVQAERNGAETAELRAILESRLSDDQRSEIESKVDETEQDEMVETGD